MIKTRNAPIRVETEPRSIRPAENREPVCAPRPADDVAIRARAYELFLDRSRNGGDGDQLTDWVRAEKELNGVNAARGESLLHDPD